MTHECVMPFAVTAYELVLLSKDVDVTPKLTSCKVCIDLVPFIHQGYK